MDKLIKFGNETRQQHGFVHGGVTGYLAVNDLTHANGSLQGDSITNV